MKTLGELASLPPADLVSRLGRPARVWQAMARGEDTRPLVPMLAEERFEASLISSGRSRISSRCPSCLPGCSSRCPRASSGAIAARRCCTSSSPRHTRSAGWREASAAPAGAAAPMRDVRTLRTLVLLDLESHPPPTRRRSRHDRHRPDAGPRRAAHALHARAADAGTALDARRAPGRADGAGPLRRTCAVDTDRPGAFAMTAFATDHTRNSRARGDTQRKFFLSVLLRVRAVFSGIVSALRRCRQPVPARVAVADGRPVRVTTDRRGFTGGTVTHCAGPWRTSGEWWTDGTRKAEVQVSWHSLSAAETSELSRRDVRLGPRRMGCVAERRRGLPRVSRSRRRPLVYRRCCGLRGVTS